MGTKGAGDSCPYQEEDYFNVPLYVPILVVLAYCVPLEVLGHPLVALFLG